MADINLSNSTDVPKKASVTNGHRILTVNPDDTNTKLELVDTDAFALAGESTNFTVGFEATPFSVAGTSGNITINQLDGQFQTLTNNGSMALSIEAKTSQVTILLENDSSAGIIDVSNFTVVDGDLLTTTDNDKFLLYITSIGTVSHLTVKALQ